MDRPISSADFPVGGQLAEGLKLDAVMLDLAQGAEAVLSGDDDVELGLVGLADLEGRGRQQQTATVRAVLEADLVLFADQRRQDVAVAVQAGLRIEGFAVGGIEVAVLDHFIASSSSPPHGGTRAAHLSAGALRS